MNSFVVRRSAAVFGLCVSLWLFGSLMVALCSYCHYAYVDGVMAWQNMLIWSLYFISVAILIMSSHGLLLSPNESAVRLWLVAIPVVVGGISVCSIAIFVVNGSETLALNQDDSDAIDDHGLISGSHGDQVVLVNAVSQISTLYNVAVVLFLVPTFCSSWYFVKNSS